MTAFVAIFALNVPFPAIVAAAAALGYTGGRYAPEKFSTGGGQAPLIGITAAVVGVILNLALFFAYHVRWPEGFAGRFETASALIGVAAALALFRFKRGIMETVGGAALAGLALHIAGLLT